MNKFTVNMPTVLGDHIVYLLNTMNTLYDMSRVTSTSSRTISGKLLFKNIETRYSVELVPLDTNHPAAVVITLQGNDIDIVYKFSYKCNLYNVITSLDYQVFFVNRMTALNTTWIAMEVTKKHSRFINIFTICKTILPMIDTNIKKKLNILDEASIGYIDMIMRQLEPED